MGGGGAIVRFCSKKGILSSSLAKNTLGILLRGEGEDRGDITP